MDTIEVEIGVYKVEEPGLWDSRPVFFETAPSLHIFLNDRALPNHIEGFICDEIDKHLNVAYENIQNLLKVNGDMNDSIDAKLRESEGHLKETVFEWMQWNLE
jgi:ATP-dependent Zn protease